MKKIYSSPVLEMVRLSATCGICDVSKFGSFTVPVPTSTVDPFESGL